MKIYKDEAETEELEVEKLRSNLVFKIGKQDGHQALNTKSNILEKLQQTKKHKKEKQKDQ